MRAWSPFRKRRALLAAVVLFAVYLFIKYLPTDVPSVGQRIDWRTGRSQGAPAAFQQAYQKTQHGNTQSLDKNQIYDGAVKFYRLSSSLRSPLHYKGPDHDSVVFLLYDLRSAITLVPLACEIALANKTVVHVALVSRQDNPIDEITRITGVKENQCPIFWHDARPDYNTQSSKSRQAVVFRSAISNLHATLQPAAFIIDEQQADDDVFKAAVTEKLASLWIPLVVLPNNALSSINWITGLDGRGLSLLSEIQIDIVIMPYKQSAGSLARLLHSIQLADYAGLPPPRITVEVPHDIDQFALHYLEYFRWPRSRGLGENKLILRRRLNTAQLTPAIASLRTIESFYPPSSPQSHILVLSPDVELSPIYLHYLMYLTIQYKYSRSSLTTTGSLMGISLDLPAKSLNDKTAFVTSPTNDRKTHPILLSQSPSSTAALYFGDKWVELQDYLSLRLRNDPSLSKSIGKDSTDISTSHPSWLKQASELMQAKNYFMLYPGFTSTSDSTKRLITIHSELHQSPEEFADLLKETSPSSIPKLPPALDKNTVLTADEESDVSQASLDHEQTTPQSRSLRTMLGLNDHEPLPSVLELPMYSMDGSQTVYADTQANAKSFAERVSLDVGGCGTLADRNEKMIGRIDYLFCGNDQIERLDDQ